MPAKHLTDMDIACLVAGVGSDPGRSALSQHLAECPSCLERIHACIRAERLVQAPNATMDTAGQQSLDKALQQQLLAAFRENASARRGNQARRIALRLIDRLQNAVGDVASGALEPIPWAAQAPSSGVPESLPVLTSADGQIRVRFRKSGPDGPLRAYLVASAPITGATIRLHIPSRSATFVLRQDGTAELPGIEIRDVVSGILEVELTPHTDGPETQEDIGESCESP